MQSIYLSVEKYPGGYKINLPNGDRIETSLNKVMSLVKLTLSQEVTTPPAEPTKTETV